MVNTTHCWIAQLSKTPDMVLCLHQRRMQRLVSLIAHPSPAVRQFCPRFRCAQLISKQKSTLENKIMQATVRLGQVRTDNSKVMDMVHEERRKRGSTLCALPCLD